MEKRRREWRDGEMVRKEAETERRRCEEEEHTGCVTLSSHKAWAGRVTGECECI